MGHSSIRAAIEARLSSSLSDKVSDSDWNLEFGFSCFFRFYEALCFAVDLESP